MYSRVLDFVTLGKVVAAAPKIEKSPRELAREILEQMAHLMDAPFPTVSDDYVWSMLIKDLATNIGGCSPKAVGQVVGEMGLIKNRTSDGYRFFWNQAQIDLLRTALEVEHG